MKRSLCILFALVCLAFNVSADQAHKTIKKTKKKSAAAADVPTLTLAPGKLAPAPALDKDRKQRTEVALGNGNGNGNNGNGNGNGNDKGPHKPTVSIITKGGSSHVDLRTLPQGGPDKFERPELEGPEATPGVLQPTVEPGDEGASRTPSTVSAQSILRVAPQAAAPAPIASFDGLDFANWGAGHPPDTNGDVGPAYYIQTINTSIGIFRKSDGVRVAAFTFNTFMSQGHFGNLCDTNNFGDPVVLYDTFEDRWIITDFAFKLDSGGNVVNPPGNTQCFAVSMNGDPVSGGWNFYSINTTGGLGDYPKFGIWPDGLYMTANMFGYASGAAFQNSRLYALNKAQMYAGSPTVQVLSFDLPSDQFTVLPANARLQTGTPPAGTPNHYASVWKFLDAVEVWDFHADWDNPALSTVTGPFDYEMPFWWAQYSGTSGRAPTPKNANDTLYPRLMMQNQYTNIGGVESLWDSHTVGAGNPTTNVSSAQSAIRFYQVDVTGGTVATIPTMPQAFTYSPDTTTFRYMPSTAVDRAGNLAIGYSTSNATTNPGLKYAGRLAGDVANSITQTEQLLLQGTGAQTGNCGSAACTRWGDYSAMSVDPADGCTFWYTNQYYADNSLNHQTRIGAFTFAPSCTSIAGQLGSIAGTVTASADANPVSGATVTFGSKTFVTGSNGNYSFNNLPVGTYQTAVVTKAGYITATAGNLLVTNGGTTIQNFSLDAAQTAACLNDASQAAFQNSDRTNLDITTNAGHVVLTHPDQIDQQNNTISSSGFAFTNTAWAGQTFTAGVNATILRADLFLFCAGCSGANPNITVSIRNTTGSPAVPTGADLATGTILGFNDGGAGGYQTVTFSPPFTMVAGTRYAMIFRLVSPRTGSQAYVVSSSSAYAGGQRVSSANSGATWTADTTGGGRDLGFHIYYNNGYSPTGIYVSGVKDSNPAASSIATWGNLSWTTTTPAATAIKFQAAASNSRLGPFNFVGPDGTSGSFFTNGGSLAQFNGNRYLKYQALFSSTDSTQTPSLDSVSICFADHAPPVLSVAASSAPYGGSATLTSTLTSSSAPVSGKSVSFTIDSDSTPAATATTDINGIATATISLTSTRSAGPHTINASFAGDSGYAAASGSGSLTVNRTDATINVPGYNVSYDGGAHTSTGTATGVFSEPLAGLDLSGTTHTDAGTYTDTWTFTDVSGNYNNATGHVTDTIGKVNAAQITIVGFNGTYDGLPHSATGTAVGNHGDDLSSLLSFTGSCTDVPGCTVNWSFAGNGDYNSAAGTATVTITPAHLTVTANNVARIYSYPNPAFSATITGFVNSQTLATSGVTGSASFSTTATQLSPVGQYPITPSLGSLAANNYDFTSFVNGTLTIYESGLIGLDRTSIGGNKASIDSFDSGVGFPASQGNGALIFSNSTITVSGAKIGGSILSSQGNVVLQPGTVVSGNVSAGTTIANQGTVGGTLTPNVSAGALVAPAVAPCTPSSDLSISGNNSMTLTAGSYCYHNVTIGGQAKLQTSGVVSITVTGVLTAAGGSIVNTTRVPADLQIASSYAGPSGVTVGGGPSSYFVIYAPSTDVAITGNASFFGAALGKTLTISGNPDVHYDTALPNIWSAYFGF